MKPIISFDYAIKHLLRNKADYEIVESFLSSLLSVFGYPPVKIKALLESESNRERKDLKRSLADMIVEDESGDRYIIEVERAISANFMHKALFNTSRLIVDSVMEDEDYTTIKKVFHITMLFEATKEMTKPLYHSETFFTDPDTKERVNLHLAAADGKGYDISTVVPEYVLIVIPRFNDVIKRDFDEWLYIMKNCKTIEDTSSPDLMEKVKKRLNILLMNDYEKDAYYRYMKEVLQTRDYVHGGIMQGREEGIEQGKEIGREIGIEIGEKSAKLAMASNLLTMGFLTIEQISEATGLSIKEITDRK